MKISGIICECNPPHCGHALLMQKAKEESDLLVMLSSGCFTERGIPSLFSPYDKAQMLLNMGADLVLELPFPFCSASADYFAKASTFLLEKIGVTDLYFGSENGNLPQLQQISKTIKTREFQQIYQEKIKSHKGTRFAFEEALSLCETKLGSNDILAVAYLSHLEKMLPHTIKREGGDYLSNEMTNFPSATALREKATQEGILNIIPYLPLEIQEFAQKKCLENSYCLEANFIDLAHKFFLLADKETIKNTPELKGGLGNRLITLAKEVANPKDFVKNAITKEYTLARIKRGMLFAMLGVKEKDLKTPPTYIRLLGANKKGLDYLSSVRYTNSFPIVTKQKDISKTSLREKELEEKTKKLYSLLSQNPKDYSLVNQSPVIEKRIKT